MRFKIYYYSVNSRKKPGGPVRLSSEEYDKNVKDLVVWVKQTFDFFNRTLRPGESTRRFVKAVVLDKDSRGEHSWKKDCLVTQMGPDGPNDNYKCSVCGITGKRFGLGSRVSVDAKFRAKAYLRCDTAEAHLKKKKGGK